MNAASGVAGIVLCGGRSSRMGRPKAWLEIDGETLLARTVRVVSGVAGEIVVVAAAGQELPPVMVTVVRDSRPDRGPLEGIAAGLAAVTAPIAVIVPCDLPRLTGHSLRELLSALGSHIGCVAILDGEPRPLPGVYCASILPNVRQLLAENRLAVRGLLGPDVVSILPSNPEAFRGSNTPEEWMNLSPPGRALGTR